MALSVLRVQHFINVHAFITINLITALCAVLCPILSLYGWPKAVINNVEATAFLTKSLHYRDAALSTSGKMLSCPLYPTSVLIKAGGVFNGARSKIPTIITGPVFGTKKQVTVTSHFIRNTNMSAHLLRLSTFWNCPMCGVYRCHRGTMLAHERTHIKGEGSGQLRQTTPREICGRVRQALPDFRSPPVAIQWPWWHRDTSETGP